MPRGNLKNKQDIEDFVRGCTFLGTGGGGFPQSGIRSLMSELEAGREIGWVDMSEIPDEELVASAYLMGSTSILSKEEEDLLKRLGLREPKFNDKEMLIEAINELSDYMKTKIVALVAPEIGAANTPGPLALGSYSHLPVVDGDYAGRAIPEIPNCSFYMSGKDIWPITCVDRFGNISILKKAVNINVAERIGKFITAATLGLAGQAAFVLTGKEMKEVLVPGTLTEILELGRFIRGCRSQSGNIPQMIADYIKGWVLIEGEMAAVETENREGYFWGTITISDGSRELKVWFKNENHMAWLNERVIATSPDIITIVRTETGEPTINAELKKGDRVAVVAMKAREMFRTGEGIKIQGPRYWGYDIDYVPVEDRIKEEGFNVYLLENSIAELLTMTLNNFW